MALRIFETDPNAKPKQIFSDDTVGRFHGGKQVDNLPVALSEWRVTTGDPEVAAAVSQLFGGAPVETDSTSENFIEILTAADKVKIVLSGPDAIASDLKLWNGSALIHHCDGVEFLSPDEDRGKLCRCPELMEDRKAAAKAKRGPSPSIAVTFRLADDYELGLFRLQTGSWKLAEVLHEVENALNKVDGEALATLELELVEYTTKKGRDVSYRKPTIRVLKSWNDAVAEPKF
ncbi:recombination directionality factor [Streptomyces erythrochromogenes]|uniref:recombination directionality factor n=1 Tax=Streptomyces erythrochromogenes TaxID=285574 RepID=UPI003448C2FE